MYQESKHLHTGLLRNSNNSLIHARFYPLPFGKRSREGLSDIFKGKRGPNVQTYNKKWSGLIAGERIRKDTDGTNPSRRADRALGKSPEMEDSRCQSRVEARAVMSITGLSKRALSHRTVKVVPRAPAPSLHHCNDLVKTEFTTATRNANTQAAQGQPHQKES